MFRYCSVFAVFQNRQSGMCHEERRTGTQKQNKLKDSPGAGEITQRLRVCTALKEGPDSAPSTHIWWLTTACNSTKGDPTFSSDLCVHHTHAQIHTQRPVLWNISLRRIVRFVYAVEYLSSDAKVCCILLCCFCLTL